MDLCYYVLQVQTQYADVLCELLNREKSVFAINPRWEYYRRDINGLALKPMFPGYVIVRTPYNQQDFDDCLKKMEVKKGFLKELKYEDVSALTKEEIAVLKKILDKDGVLRMSYGHIDGRRIVVDEGPLVGFESYITKVDKHNRMLNFDLFFLENQKWYAGITITSDNSK